MRPSPEASVVVPTRDRPEALAACLAALHRQTGVDLEVVVVDDGSVDEDAVASVVRQTRTARLVRGQGRGPAAARNLGAAAARGAVVGFTDDDCRPEPGWAAALVAAITAGAAAAAGPTVNGRPHDPYAVAAQTITNHLTESGLDAAGRRATFAPTCNLAVRSDVAARLPFDESFPLAAGEDREWCARLAASGHALAHVPDAVVHHHPELGWRRFWAQQVRYGRGAHHLRSTTDAGRLGPPAFYLGLMYKGLAQGPRVAALVLVAQVATATGVVRSARAQP